MRVLPRQSHERRLRLGTFAYRAGRILRGLSETWALSQLNQLPKQLNPRTRARFAQHIFLVEFHGAGADAESHGDVVEVAAETQELENLSLAFGELRGLTERGDPLLDFRLLPVDQVGWRRDHRIFGDLPSIHELVA